MSGLSIYYNPLDYPGKFVLRWQKVIRGAVLVDPDPLAIVDTLEQARQAVPYGLVRLVRHPANEPQIVESWV